MLAQGHIYPTNLLCKSGFTNSDRPQLEIRTQISESPGYMARRSTTLCRCRYVACRGPALSESSGRSGLRINKPHVEPHLSWRIHPLSSMFSYQIWITPSLPISVGWSLVSIYMISWCAKISTLPKSVNFSSKLHHQRLPLLQWWECLPWVGSDLGCRAVGAPSHSAPLANPWLSARRPGG